MSSFLEYVPGTSPLHRMNPVAKLAAAAAFALACFCSSNLAFLAVLLAAGFALAATCGMVRPAIGLAKAVFAFSLILAVVQVLTTPSGAVLVELPWGYVGTGSLLAALTTVVRLVAAAIPLFLVFYVTKMNDITNAVVKVLHVPYKYAFTFTSTIHFCAPRQAATRSTRSSQPTWPRWRDPSRSLRSPWPWECCCNGCGSGSLAWNSRDRSGGEKPPPSRQARIFRPARMPT